MPGRKICLYANCKEYRDNKKKDVHVFSFPSDNERRLIWKRNCGNPNLPADIDTGYKNKHLCDKHFSQSSFHDARRTKLIRTAVPMPYVADEAASQPEAPLPLRNITAALASASNSNVPVSKCSPVVAAVQESTIEMEIDTVPTTPKSSCASGAASAPVELQTPKENVQPAAVEQDPVTPKTGRLNHPRRTNGRVSGVALLKESGVSTAEVTPRKKRMLITTRKYQSVAKKLERQVKKLRCDVAGLKKLMKDENIWMRLETLTSPGVAMLVENEIKNKKPGKKKGRRYSPDFKAWSIAVWKRAGARGYRWLRNFWILPDERTVKRWLADIPIDVGISPSVMEHLKKKVEKMKPIDRKCVLMFDEMFHKSSLYYHQGKGYIVGNENFGKGRTTTRVADHVLTFMVQGTQAKWKQPISFYFVKDSCREAQLEILIQENVEALQEIGLDVVATVCDQGPNNRSAIEALKRKSDPPQIDNQYNFGQKDGKMYSHIYDVPHVLKGMRNNFITSDIITPAGVAQWEHIVQTYEKDRELYRMMHKLTDSHIRPQGREKMTVSRAAQVLSRTVHATMGTMNECSDGKLLGDAAGTMHVIDKCNQYFDITNGPSGPQDVKGPYRENVSRGSSHHKDWIEMRKDLRTWTFRRKYGKRKGTLHHPPSLTSWIANTIQFARIWKNLEAAGAKYMNLRQFTQDSLENFFGIIRQSCGSGRDPTVSHFIAAFKTAIITGMTGAGRGKNCEDDDNSLLSDLRSFLESGGRKSGVAASAPDGTSEPPQKKSFPLVIPGASPDDLKFAEGRLTKIERQAPAYVCGFLVKQVICKLKLSGCRICCSDLKTEDELSSDHLFTKRKDFGRMRALLVYPSPAAIQAFIFGRHNLVRLWVRRWADANLKQLAEAAIEMAADWSWLTCPDHQGPLKEMLVGHFARMNIKTQVKRLNEKLNIRFKRRKRGQPKPPLQNVVRDGHEDEDIDPDDPEN